MKRVHVAVMLMLQLVLCSACDRSAAPSGPASRAGLERGPAAAATWIEAGRSDSVTQPTAIALGYLERLRLGLGSPFRLIDFAMQDPRLSDSTRITLAWSLFARTLAGDAYEIDDASLDRAGAGSVTSWPGVGRRHLDLITRAIEESRDARSGELAVRLGYTLAATEGSLPAHAPRYAASVAALVRDRELSKLDAADVLRAAGREHRDALQVLQQWRAERRLRVEQPALAALPQDAEREALAIAPRIATSLRELGARQGSITAVRAERAGVRPTLLHRAAARRLLAIAAATQAPPVAPLVIGARGYHRELVAQPWLDRNERARRRGLEAAGSEEHFVAQYALLDRTSPYDVVPSLVATWGAVGMRTMAQEAVWYPGYPAPSARELAQRYGLASVSFGASVPSAWRPYYRRMLDASLRDLQTVLPSLDLHGMSVRFQDIGKGEGTLAMHDPKRRQLLLPPSTAAGTLAHEIAHDLDWQVALRRYHVRGDYATDRAVRAGAASGDRLALRMQDLAVGSTVPESTSPRLIAHSKRPAEILARNIDWFVTAALADQGRVNGYLSSVQDEMLTGYGTVRAPEVTGVAADAIITILDQIAPVYPGTRDRFLRMYGSGRSLRSYDLARRVIETDIDDADATATAATSTSGDARVFEGIAHARALGDDAINVWICRSPGGANNAQLEDARRRLVGQSASARARGYAIGRARELMGRKAGEWVAGQLFGGPWHVDGVTDEMESYLGALVAGARTVDERPSIGRQPGFGLSQMSRNGDALAPSCSGSPFGYSTSPDATPQGQTPWTFAPHINL